MASTQTIRCSRALARAAEGAFVGGLSGRMEQLGACLWPGAGPKARPLPIVGVEPVGGDRRAELARLAERHRADGQRDCPVGARAIASVPRPGWLGGLLGSKTALTIAAVSAVRLEPYLVDGADEAPLTAAELEQQVGRLGLAGGPTFLGILSPTGFAADASPELFGSRERQVALIAPAPSADGSDALGFRGVYPAGALPALRALFDPEPAEAKSERAARLITAREELRLPGGVLLLDGMTEAWGLDKDELAAGVARVTAADPALKEDHVADEWIVRRARR